MSTNFDTSNGKIVSFAAAKKAQNDAFLIESYLDNLSEKRETLSFILAGQSKVDVFLHPFKTVSAKYRLRRVDKIDKGLCDVVSTCVTRDDYNKRVKTFIMHNPIR